MVAPHWAAKGIPCAFNLQKAGAREQNARNMQATREKHARNMRVFPAADYTAPAPFSGDGQCPMSGIHSHGRRGSEPTRKTDSQKALLGKPNSSGFSRLKIMKSIQSSVELCYL